LKLVEIDWNPSVRKLRQFGLVCLVVLPLLGWLWIRTTNWIGALAAVGLALAVAGLAAPQVLRPVFVAISLIAAPIGLVVGELTMAAIYFGVFLPTGLIFRFIGRDALQRKLDRQATTYWQAKRPPTSVASYYRQS
jgi:hypothetical protein